MSETKKPNFLSKLPFFKKLKSIKNIEIIIALILGAIILLIYLSSDISSSNSSSNNSTTEINYTTASEYREEIENKLAKVISNIKGVGDVSVMVVISTSSELIIAKTVEETTETTTVTKDGTTTTQTTTETISTPIIIETSDGSSSPIVLLEIMPTITGVLIIAEGADNITVKLNIIKAVQALLGVNSGNIEVIEGD
ncbi:MAG: hypothetical protein WCS51_00410 [Bacilli bacterium]